jgi:hypothetical protein
MLSGSEAFDFSVGRKKKILRLRFKTTAEQSRIGQAARRFVVSAPKE